MSNRLPSTQTTPAPSTIEAWIGAFHGQLVAHPVHPTRYCVPLAKALTTAERRALSGVAERLEAELAPWAEPRHVDTIVSRVLLGFEVGRGRDEHETDVLVGEYIDALRGLPLAAIHAAAERFRNGATLKPWTRRFRPSPAEFATEVREGLIPLRTRLIHARRVLDAEVIGEPSDEDRKKVQTAAAAWLRRASEGEDGLVRPCPEEIAAAREAHLHEVGVQFREHAGPNLARLMDRLGERSTAAVERLKRQGARS